MLSIMLFFRVQFELEITATVPRLHPHHGPLLYALLCQANAAATGEKPSLPIGLTPVAVEQLRVFLRVGDRYAFGVSLLRETVASATELVARIHHGLQIVGHQQRRRGQSLAGNFTVASVYDCITGTALQDQEAPTPVDEQAVLQECLSITDASHVTLEFLSPLRSQLPRPMITTGNRYLNRACFPPEVFLKRLPARLQACGLDTEAPPVDYPADPAEVLANDLVWLDIDYRRGKQKRMRLGGAVGTVTFHLPATYPRHWLIWGQYTAVGESTRFDHGRYRIREIGSDPYACRRSENLLALATRTANLERAAAESDCYAPQIACDAKSLRQGEYLPPAPQRIWLEQAGAQPRELAVPSQIDRVLQRAVCQVLHAGLDAFFETSSFAYRKGLSRKSAAKRLEALYQEGYRYAVRADFERFFDSIQHAELEARLHTYLADKPMVAALMAWVRAGTASSDACGLPTGYPISPLLANLFLDRFDEVIAANDASLVRYADDFLIVTRDAAQAEEMRRLAEATAESLRLKLNQEKTHLQDLTEPFDFLGYRFVRSKTWAFAATGAPRLVDELGWTDLSTAQAPGAPRVRLPGEQPLADPPLSTTLILDSQAARIGCEGGQLVVTEKSGQRITGPPLSQLEQVLALGAVSFDASFLPSIHRAGVTVLICDTAGHVLMEWCADPPDYQADLLATQLAWSQSDALRLAVARSLVSAKLHNYAVLARSYPSRHGDDQVVDQLRRLSRSADQAESLPELLGYEGAGAAAWYQSLAGRLPSSHRFVKRVSPQANDPINVMLNIAQTHLYRQARIAARMAGLAPELGFLHRPHAGFAPLAADLQEPFRMLMDRAVIEAAYKIRSREFSRVEQGPFPLQMSFAARRKLLRSLYETLKIVCSSPNESDPASYHQHLLRLARGLRRWLKAEAPTNPTIFRLPEPQ